VIDRDAREPGGKARPGTEIGDVAKGIEIRILQRVLCLRIVPQDGTRYSEELPVVAPHQRLEGPVILMSDALDERNIVIRLRAESRLATHFLAITPLQQ
jgi:hypothetical protein